MSWWGWVLLGLAVWAVLSPVTALLLGPYLRRRRAGRYPPAEPERAEE